MVVTNIDSMLIGGTYRKSIKIQPIQPGGQPAMACFTPGIGIDCAVSLDFGYGIQCHSNDGNAIIAASPACFGFSIDETNAPVIELYPNPVEYQFTE